MPRSASSIADPSSQVAAALVLAIVAGLAGADGQDRPSDGQRSERTIAHGGRQRTYRVHDFAGSRPAPVVIVLHGGGGNAANAVRMTGFDRVAAREAFIAVYPDGSGGRARSVLLTWNAGHCCAAAMDQQVDDVGFVEAIVDALVASGRGDASRIYVTGISNGAMMAHRLGRELSLKIAAIAPVVGAVFGDEPPPRAPMPAFIVVGAQDTTVPARGGSLRLRELLGGRSAADRDVAPAIAQAAYWARHNGCSEPTRTTTAVSATSAWHTCSSGAPVIFHSVAGNGHAWPGGQPGGRSVAPPATAFDATEAIWTFFRSQRRPRAGV
jgi:polyhydroxybutyrate depolymerase